MTETKRKNQPQLSTSFSKIVAGSSPVNRLALLFCLASTLHCLSGIASHAGQADVTATRESIEMPSGCGLIPIGRLKPRCSREIASNRWNISCAALDRDYTIYDNYKAYLGPLGAKSARIAGGWAKTEHKKGKYDFTWIDSVVNDLRDQGMHTWFGLRYGNPIYNGGGGYDLGAGLPSSPEGLSAWDNYVRATVRHFRDRVFYWEIWNEPNGGAGRKDNAPEQYGDLFIRTAEIIRELQPESRIAGLSTAGIPLGYIKSFLDHLQAHGKLGLIDEVSFHLKPVIPDAKYAAVEKLQALVAMYSSRIVVIQGENGCPSVPKGQDLMALRQYDWTETSQAKWYLRDMLGDYARGIPHAIFTMIDIHYPQGVLHKGLLAATPDKRVDHPKLSYSAVQNAITIFDDTFERITNVSYRLEPIPLGADTSMRQKTKGKDPFVFHAFKKKDSQQSLFATWRSDQRPAHEFPIVAMKITYTGSVLQDPVCVDLLSGRVYEIAKAQWSVQDVTYTFQNIPVYDSPILIIERSLLHTVKPPAPTSQQ